MKGKSYESNSAQSPVGDSVCGGSVLPRHHSRKRDCAARRRRRRYWHSCVSRRVGFAGGILGQLNQRPGGIRKQSNEYYVGKQFGKPCFLVWS
ncbi:hypothetical protein GCM10027344_22750 [Spelaeicoccus albus]